MVAVTEQLMKPLQDMFAVKLSNLGFRHLPTTSKTDQIIVCRAAMLLWRTSLSVKVAYATGKLASEMEPT